MENNERDSFIDDRLAVLDPAGAWRPDPVRGLERLYARDRAGVGSRRRRWTWAVTTASAVGLLLLAVSAPQACAWGACLKPAGLTGANAVVPGKAAPGKAAPENFAFKTSGSASAPITLEIYSDYECPHCARFYDETVPLIVAQYVSTGKVRLIHRDLPLPQHAWARLAARYANAAGELGQYDRAVNQIFRTQDAWRENGNIDAQLAQVLPPGLMQKVREKVMRDSTLDQTIAADLEMVSKDHVNQTPSLVIESKGKRGNIGSPPSFGVLKDYLDQLLRE